MRTWRSGRPAKEVTWEELTAKAPVLVATMRRYLDQCLLSLRPSSVACFDTTFRFGHLNLHPRGDFRLEV